MKKFLSNLQVKVEDWMTICGAGAIAVMMLITIVDVTMRKGFVHPVKGSYEIISLLFVAVVFFGLAYAQRQDQHISVEILYNRLPPRVRRLIRGIVLVLSLGIFVLLTWSSITIAVWAWKMGDTILGAMPVPTWPARTIIPVGAGMLCLRFLVQLVGLATERDEDRG